MQSREASSKLLIFFSTILLTLGVLALGAMVAHRHHHHHEGGHHHGHHAHGQQGAMPAGGDAIPPFGGEEKMPEFRGARHHGHNRERPFPAKADNSVAFPTDSGAGTGASNTEASPSIQIMPAFDTASNSQSASLPMPEADAEGRVTPLRREQQTLGHHGGKHSHSHSHSHSFNEHGHKHHKCHLAHWMVGLTILAGLVGVKAGFKSSPCGAKAFIVLLIVLSVLHGIALHRGARKALRHCDESSTRMMLETRMVAYRVPGAAIVASETSAIGNTVDEHARHGCIHRVKHVVFAAGAGVQIFFFLEILAAALMLRAIKRERWACACTPADTVVLATVVCAAPKPDPFEGEEGVEEKAILVERA